MPAWNLYLLCITKYFECANTTEEKEMNETQAREEIRLIREMIDKTKQSAADYWKIFFCWGFVGILGVIGMYVLVFLKKFAWIWINWFVFIGIGIVFTVLFSLKKEKTQGVKTYTYNSIFHLSFSSGIDDPPNSLTETICCMRTMRQPSAGPIMLSVRPYGEIPLDKPSARHRQHWIGTSSNCKTGRIGTRRCSRMGPRIDVERFEDTLLAR